MSVQSDPNINPSKPDPVTRNQPEMEKANTDERSGTEDMPGNYPMSPGNSTSEGGYGAAPEKIWSNRAQRGTDMPLGPGDSVNSASAMGTDKYSDTGLIDQSTNGTNLKDQLQDAIQGTDKSFITNSEDDEWGVEKGAGKDF